MKILVCVKQVPDSWSERQLTAEHTLDRGAADRVINDLDTYAVEAALQLQETHGGQTIALSMGPELAEDAIRKALQMGIDEGVLVTDAALAGSDAIATSLALTKAIEKVAPDLVIMGVESTDAKMSVVPAMVAERLGWPMLTLATSVVIEGVNATITRQTAAGHDVVTADLPAVVSVVEKFNEPRYPSFKGITSAKKKTVDHWGIADLGIDAATVGTGGSATTVTAAVARPARSAGVIIEDDGTAVAALVDFLAQRRLI
ncbi:MAG: electron transfer flavoprotein beta subunit/FixA family protein [Actinobacteria bacterium]|nr:electron transfer flavoprotein beta subunit/FixA family protein [Actinomycetota bacterium]